MDRGTYFEHDGRPAVRFQRTYARSAEALWAAVSDPEELAHWFPSAAHIEPREGGTVTFGGDPNTQDTTGRVLVYDPPRRLAYTWGANELHFTIDPLDGQHATLTLIDVLDEARAAARNAAGWSVCLGELDKHVAGERADGPHSASATPWRPLYDEYVAAGMPSGAPIPTPAAPRG